MNTTQHTPTLCRVLAHPAATPARIFEVRRLAREAGCQYISTHKRNTGIISTPSTLGGTA